ncbi:MAG: O-antigen ligase family protein [Chitinophagaceae bacterium]|nr:O-antigen ligase family protein [Chitinophagaceae bacterium]
MAIWKKIYLHLLVTVYALYCYFNKGIAYTYLTEGTLVIGILLMLKHIKQYVFIWRKETAFIVFFLMVTAVQTAVGIGRYGIKDTIRDSFVMNYAWYVFIIFLFVAERDILEKKIARVYAFFPAIVSISFLLRAFFPALNNFILVGNHPFLAYKNGDIAVHLFVCLVLMLNNKIAVSPRLLQLNYLLIGYLALVSATYSRGGMLSFIIPLGIYFVLIRKTPQEKKYISYLKFVPVALLIALPLYLSTKLEDKVQGRKIGVEQLTENVTSIVNQDSRKVGKTLNDNVVWRLSWWATIIDYTFTGPYFFQGKGLGINLATSDEIRVDDDTLRSPHNYNMTLLARYGVPFFILWLVYLVLLWKPLFTIKQNPDILVYTLILLAFFINASFDVSLEGPVMAMPFWLFTGVLLLKKAEIPS